VIQRSVAANAADIVTRTQGAGSIRAWKSESISMSSAQISARRRAKSVVTPSQ